MGLVGALCLALSFYGSGSLPLNMLGVVLVVHGIVMLVLEPNVPSHGLLDGGRIVVVRCRSGGLLRFARPVPAERRPSPGRSSRS